jgi:hypothetical protein
VQYFFGEGDILMSQKLWSQRPGTGTADDLPELFPGALLPGELWYHYSGGIPAADSRSWWYIMIINAFLIALAIRANLLAVYALKKDGQVMTWGIPLQGTKKNITLIGTPTATLCLLAGGLY